MKNTGAQHRKKRRFWMAVCIYFSCLSPHAAFSQSVDYGSLESVFAEPITTSATGIPQRVPDVPVKMYIVTSDDIRRTGANTVPDALRNVPGMSVMKWTRSQDEVSIRGYNQAFSSRLLILVNGRQVYSDNYGYMPWGTLPVQMSEIRQIEVIEGPNTALYGFNAVGGVINIITYNPLYDQVSEVGGTLGTGAYTGGYGIYTKKIGDNFGMRVSTGGDNANFFKPSATTTAVTDDNNMWKSAFNMDAIMQMPDRSQLRLEMSNSHNVTDEYIYRYFDVLSLYTASSAKLTYDKDTSLGQIQASMYRNWTRIEPNPVAGVNYHNSNVVTVAQLSDMFRMGTHNRFRVGAEFRDNWMSGNLLDAPGSSIGYQVYALDGMWEWTMRDDLRWTNAVREDYLTLSRDGPLPANPYYASNDDFSQDAFATSFNSGLVWQPRQKDTYRLTVARGIQAPSLTEFGSYSAIGPTTAVGNPDISPTVVMNYELGYDHTLDAIGGNAGASVFYQQTDDIKAMGVNTSGVFNQSGNIGNSKSYGVEFSVKGTVDENWRWDASYTFQRVFDDLSVNNGGAITVGYDSQDASPVHSLNAHVGYSKGKWETDLYGNYVSSYKMLEPGAGGTYALGDVNNYISLSGRIGYKVTDSLTMSLSGQELNHESVSQTTGTKAGRQVFVSLKKMF